MEITKAYFMLPVADMDRALRFYQQVFGPTLDFSSPFWSELHWKDATIALHGGGDGSERESNLGFHVTDLDAAVAAVEAPGGRSGQSRTQAGARLIEVVDPDGNKLTLGQDV